MRMKKRIPLITLGGASRREFNINGFRKPNVYIPFVQLCTLLQCRSLQPNSDVNI